MKLNFLNHRGRTHDSHRIHLAVECLETRALLATVLRSAHVHLQMNFSNGAWGAFQIEDTTHGISYAPEDVMIFVDPVQKTTQPAGWNFIGAGNGNPYWRMDSSSSSPFVSLSVATEHIPNGTFDVYQPADPRVTFAGEWVRLELKEVKGPGFVSSWQNGQPPNSWWMSSFDDSQTLDSAFFTEPGGHTHLNWGFTKKGVYEVTFEASAFFGGDPRPVVSEEVVLTFGVERLRKPPSPNLPPPIPISDSGHAVEPRPSQADLAFTDVTTWLACPEQTMARSAIEPQSSHAGIRVRPETVNELGIEEIFTMEPS